jgi:carbonic anhydrase
MTVIDDMVAANEHFADALGEVEKPALPPKRKVAIVTCMDARIVPARIFGLEEGDAHVIRNAGGRTPEALRSLVISERLLGTEAVMVVQHTDCGMLTFTMTTSTPRSSKISALTRAASTSCRSRISTRTCELTSIT